MSAKPRVIKKYPNRRLYDTQASGYVTLTEVRQLVVDQEAFQVVDAKTGDDLTRSILLQIILEQDASGTPMFSNEMLSQMVRFYEHSMQGLIGQLLEQNVRAYMDIQSRLGEQAKAVYGDKATPPMGDLWKQFLQMQTPSMQGMVGNYLEHSAKLFLDMQKQMQSQSASFPFPFPMPGLTPGSK